MKAALVVLALLAVSHRVAFTALGQPVPVPWLIAAAEILASAGAIWLAVRAIRRFRSAPWMRAGVPAGGWQ